MVLETLKRAEIRLCSFFFRRTTNSSRASGEIFSVCYQNYFTHKFRSSIEFLCKPSGWKLSLNTLIASQRSPSYIKFKFFIFFFRSALACLEQLHSLKRRFISCKKEEKLPSLHFNCEARTSCAHK